MSMSEWALGQEKLGNHEAAFKGRKLAREFGEIPLPQSALVSPTEQGRQLPTREDITSTFSLMWVGRSILLRNAGIDTDLTFEPCSYSQEELNELEANGRRVGYLPPELADKERRHLLGIIYSHVRISNSVKKGNAFINEVDRSGWFDYEINIDAPHQNTTEESLRTAIGNEGRLEMTLNEYIVASHDSKILTGKYLDETGTMSRLLGSRGGAGRVVHAQFDTDGYLFAFSNMLPEERRKAVGGRSVGVPKAAKS